MKRKTISLDVDVHRLLVSRKGRKETLSAALRRMLAEEQDPADYLDDLFAHPPKVDVALLRRRQQYPPRSPRPRRAA